MGPTLVQTLVFVALAAVATASGPTKIYINQVPEYTQLATCAEPEVSFIVRDMYFGCGDGSRTTSYACFCYQSSSRFSSMIENHVSTACPKDASQRTLALGVFSDYCQLGQIAAVPTDAPESATGLPAATPSPSLSQPASTSVSTSASASLSSGPATVFVTTSPTPTSESGTVPSTPSKKSPPAAAIAAGVSIPIVVIALSIAGLMFYRRRTQASRPMELSSSDRGLDTSEGYQKSPVVVHELKEDYRFEIGESERRVETTEATKDAQRYELGTLGRQ
ncbi:hypothetical protein K505DRAFT_418372 [Melanomma pulvis-pyrius CBS 109.77]|uniref:Extracellular membrane protein CFEM domain-containing protein n=1 Tax=Melanomma pulvis-pyrius CBS 109.77 TaxID=1314802 RepID=A0A6A6X869_9PLEO|nr:hypothetical protein K505DRAFT_418372 [Melanomma pulvis-pyrius CBS 109.77]